MQLRSLSVRAVALLCPLSIGCQNNTQTGAAIGSGLGALTGAIIGHQTGNKETGALIGAAAGAVGGGLLGNAADVQEERDAAITHAQHTEMARRADQMAVTNRDVINMTRKGVSDRVIVSTVQSRGGRFDTSPDAVIYMKENGVSDAVIQTMQRYTTPY